MKNTKTLWSGLGFLAVFVLWTVLVCHVDVQMIEPDGSCVGFAAMNRAFHELTGVHWTLYIITNWLGLVPLGFMFGFAVLGLVQLIRRRSLCKVDWSVLALDGFYLIVMAPPIFCLRKRSSITARC